MFSWDQKRWTLVCLSASVAVVNTTFSLLAPIFPDVAAAKGVGPTMTGLIFSSYSIVTVVASPVIAQMLSMRMVSRMRCLFGGILLVGLSSAAFGTVSHIDDTDTFVVVCLSLRFLLGLGCAAVDTAATAVVAYLYGEDAQLGSAMGLVEACLGVGWVVGPGLGGLLAEAGGFGLPFYLVAAATLLIGPLPVMLVSHRLDGAPAKVSRNRKEAMTVWKVLPMPAMQLLLLTAMLGAAALTAVDPTLQPHLQASGFSIAFVGGSFAIRSLVYAGSAPLVGWVSDLHGQGPMMVTGCLVTGASFALLGPVPGLGLPVASTSLILLALVMMGVGSCMVFVPALSAMMAVALERFGHVEGLEDVLSGLLNSSYYLGGGVMPMIGGAMTESAGFAWAAAVFGLVMAAQCVVLRLGMQIMPTITSGSLAALTGRDSNADAYSKLQMLPEAIALTSHAVAIGQRTKAHPDRLAVTSGLIPAKHQAVVRPGV